MLLKMGERPPVFCKSMRRRHKLNKSPDDLRAIARAARAQENESILRQTGNFMVGDTVKVINRTELPHSLDIGEVGKIERIDRAGYCKVYSLSSYGYWQWVAPCDLELWEE